MNKLRAYYTLTKPGIIRGNAIHAFAGALLASTIGFDVGTIVAVLAGTSLVIASACVANNLIDRDIDSKMKRTKHRASVTGEITVPAAVLYLLVLAALGFATLTSFTNGLVVAIGVVAYSMYVFVYGYVKRRSTLSTVVGAIPGALPTMAGYIAVTGELSLAAVLVFLVVFAWQMPHFYAISIFRKKEYAAANVPVLGVVKSFQTVRWHIFAYMVLYLASIIGLIMYDVVGTPSGLLLLCGAAYWFFVFANTSTHDESRWAKSVFGSSLLLTLILLAASAMNIFVPPIG